MFLDNAVSISISLGMTPDKLIKEEESIMNETENDELPKENVIFSLKLFSAKLVEWPSDFTPHIFRLHNRLRFQKKRGINNFRNF